MKIELRELDEETGDVNIKGVLNRKEVEFIIQFGINMLMARGAAFNIEGEGDEGEMRIQLHGDNPVQ